VVAAVVVEDGHASAEGHEGRAGRLNFNRYEHE
jgi:hypothetical protein